MCEEMLTFLYTIWLFKLDLILDYFLHYNINIK